MNCTKTPNIIKYGDHGVTTFSLCGCRPSVCDISIFTCEWCRSQEESSQPPKCPPVANQYRSTVTILVFALLPVVKSIAYHMEDVALSRWARHNQNNRWRWLTKIILTSLSLGGCSLCLRIRKCRSPVGTRTVMACAVKTLSQTFTSEVDKRCQDLVTGV